MMARIVMLALGVAISASTLWSESTDCGSPVIIIPDGRVAESTFAQTTTYWYGIYAVAGHSYAIEFEPPADNFNSASRPQFSSLLVFGPNDALRGCHGSSSISVTGNESSAPTIKKNADGAGRRVSFFAWTAGLYLIAVSNVAGAGDYTFRASDTTLFNMRWSTFGGYSNQWVFLNLSDMSVTGIFVLYDLNNRALLAIQVNVPPSGVVVRYSDISDLNLPGNLSGYGVFGHNGPEGAIAAEVYTLNTSGTQMIHSKFERRTTD